jgi:transcriptional regulator of acetoin/glycerol metabolism
MKELIVFSVSEQYFAPEGARDRGRLIRRDLFHRLSVFTVTLPPLRERRGDIGPIARALLASAPDGVTARTLTPRALARLIAHDWSGNVRELRAVLYRASDHAQRARTIDLVDVEEGLRVEQDEAPVVVQTEEARALLNEYRGNVTHAARAAGMPRSTFRKRLRGE